MSNIQSLVTFQGRDSSDGSNRDNLFHVQVVVILLLCGNGIFFGIFLIWSPQR